MSGLARDLRHAVRALRGSPAFTVAAVLCLALGIGTTSTMFALVDSMSIRPVPYPEPDRLVAVHGALLRRDGVRSSLSYPDFADWRAGARSFEALAAVDHRLYNLSAGTEPEHVHGAAVSAEFLRAFGVRPALGRDLLPDDDRPGTGRVVLLGDRLWRRRFAAEPSVVGRSVLVNGEPATVVGVLPEDFEFPEFAQLWTPFALDPAREPREERYLEGVGRLKHGVTAASAQAELASVARRLEEAHPGTNAGFGARVTTLRDRLVPPTVRTGNAVMLGAAGLVLLVACANVANLMLARAAGRSREIALRLALGAGRGRVARLLLVESLVVALAGGALGLVLATWGLDLARSAVPVDVPSWIRLEATPRTAAFTVLVSLVAAVAAGLAPSLQASRPSLEEALREGGRSGEGVRRHRLRGGLVVSELALALVLLLSAVLLVRSFRAMQRIDPGFEPESALTLRLTLAGPAYDEPERRVVFFRDLAARIEALPEVEAAGVTDVLPPVSSWTTTSFEIEGRPADPGEAPEALLHPVTDRYTEALGLPVVRGRGLSEAEAFDSTAAVTLVSESLARLFGANLDPIGRRLRLGEGEPWLTVVGVTADAYQGLDLGGARKPDEEIFVPYARIPRRDAVLVVRAAGDLGALAPAVTSRLRAADPALPAFDVLPLSTVFERSIWMPRFLGKAFGVLAALAVLLAGLGVYGVVSYAVSRRTREIGVRMALGARAADVVRQIVTRTMGPTLLGICLGILGGLAATRLLATLLYEVSPRDPVAFVVLPLVLAGVALLACWLPARRAARVDPMTTLRYE